MKDYWKWSGHWSLRGAPWSLCLRGEFDHKETEGTKTNGFQWVEI